MPRMMTAVINTEQCVHRYSSSAVLITLVQLSVAGFLGIMRRFTTHGITSEKRITHPGNNIREENNPHPDIHQGGYPTPGHTPGRISHTRKHESRREYTTPGSMKAGGNIPHPEVSTGVNLSHPEVSTGVNLSHPEAGEKRDCYTPGSRREERLLHTLRYTHLRDTHLWYTPEGYPPMVHT